MGEQASDSQGQQIDLKKAKENAHVVLAGMDIKAVHDGAVVDRDASVESARLYADAVATSTSARVKIEGADQKILGAEGLKLGARERNFVKTALQNQKKELTSALESNLKKAQDADTTRKAAAYDAAEHFRYNKETYKADAIVDANAAGHDITYEGVKYPADASAPQQLAQEQQAPLNPSVPNVTQF